MRRRDDLRPRRAAGLRPSGGLSLARALSKFGVCSRREAERRVEDGRVGVNGLVARDPAAWVDPRVDRVTVDGQPVGGDLARVVVAFHKPVGCITTRVDPGGRTTVYDALGDLGRWLFPVGRLDRDSSGLLLLTNDHRLGQRLTSPEAQVPKTYHARVAGVPGAQALRALREGLSLPDGTLTRPAQVRTLGSPRTATGGQGQAGSTWLAIVLREGKNRQVRRMCAAVGHQVLELVRVAVGRLELAGLGLAPGEWRELRPDEVDRLGRGRR